MPLNPYTGRYGKFFTDNKNNLFNIDVPVINVFNVILIDIFFL